MLSHDVSTEILVLWDGECGLCGRLADALQTRAAGKPIRCLPFQAAPTPPMTPELRERCAESLQVVTSDGETLAAGQAVARIMSALGWRRLAWLARRRPGSWFLDIGYRLVARHRRRLSRWLGLQACSIGPSTTQVNGEDGKDS